MAPTSTLLTTSEVAARLRVHPRTVAHYAHKGDLRGIPVGNALRFDADEVEAYLRRDVADLDSVVERLVAAAPALTEAQRTRLATLLQQPVGAR